jgi:hypothetical protein
MHSIVRPRRSTERALVAVIESADKGSLTMLEALSRLTRDWAARLDLDVSAWPTDVKAVVYGDAADRRWVLKDDFKDAHRFAILEMDGFDILFSVSTRREQNVPKDRSGNLATNTLLDLLAEEADEADGRRKYGRLVAVKSSRLWRNVRGGAFVTEECREWDVRILCEDFTHDPVTDPSSLLPSINVATQATNATALVVGASDHRVSAHLVGVCKWARTATPAVVAVHPETKQVSWDLRVVHALREVVRLRRKGKSWDECAQAVGHDIPSYKLQAEPDHVPDAASPRMRSRGRRSQRGRQVPFKYDETGNVSPHYIPETLLDTAQPGVALRNLFLEGCGIPAKQGANVEAQVDSHLGGLHPRETTLELLGRGVFRRLVKDQAASNSAIRRYKYVEYQMPPVEAVDGKNRFVLTDDEVRFLRRERDHDPSRAGTMPLAGDFKVVQQAPLYTGVGLVIHTEGGEAELLRHDGTTVRGRLVFATARQNAVRGYRVVFAPYSDPGTADDDAVRSDHGDGSTDDGDGSTGVGDGSTDDGDEAPAKAQVARVLLGFVEATRFHRSFVESVCAALSLSPSNAHFVESDATRGTTRTAVQKAKDVVTKAEQTHTEASDALLGDLDDLTRKHLQKRAADAADAVLAARVALEAARDTEAFTASETVEIAGVEDYLAGLLLPVPLSPEVCKALKALGTDFFVEGGISVDPVSQQVCWTVVLEVRAPSGRYLQVPISARLDNEARDSWLGGVCGAYWARRAPMQQVLADEGRQQRSQDLTRLRRLIIPRLLGEPSTIRWKGANAANLFVRCPHPLLVRIGRALSAEEPTTGHPTALVDEMRRVFFATAEEVVADLPDPRACNWDPTSRRSGVVDTLLSLLEAQVATDQKSPVATAA